MATSARHQHQQQRASRTIAAGIGAALCVAAGAVSVAAAGAPPAHSQAAERQEHKEEGAQELPLEFVEGLKAIVGESNVTTDPDEYV